MIYTLSPVSMCIKLYRLFVAQQQFVTFFVVKMNPFRELKWHEQYTTQSKAGFSLNWYAEFISHYDMFHFYIQSFELQLLLVIGT